jgi:hypothetical protein
MLSEQLTRFKPNHTRASFTLSPAAWTREV